MSTLLVPEDETALVLYDAEYRRKREITFELVGESGYGAVRRGNLVRPFGTNLCIPERV